MSRAVPILFLMPAVLAAGLGGCDRGPVERAQDGGLAGEPQAAPASGELVRGGGDAHLPALVLSDPQGETLDLAELEGPVLMNLWATWCAPCVVEMPMLDTLARELEGEVRVLAVSQDLRGAQVVEPFFAVRDFAHLEPWLDPDAELTSRFAEDGRLPVTILFDADGREVLRVEGAYEWDSDEAIALVREALAEG